MSDSMTGDLVAHAIEGAAADIVITVDQHGRITSWNAAAVHALGYSAAEALGQSLALIVPEQHRPRHIAGFTAAMASGHLQHDGHAAIVEGTAKDGRLIPLEMTLGLLDRDRAGAAAAGGAVAILRRGATTPISFI